jgi:hypothetical protein
MAPLQLLTRVATAQPNLAANLTFGRLAPLQEVSGENSTGTSPMSSFREQNGSGSEGKRKEEIASQVAEAVAAADAASAEEAEHVPADADTAATAAKDDASKEEEDDKDDQFAYLNKIEIEVDDDDLPS